VEWSSSGLAAGPAAALALLSRNSASALRGSLGLDRQVSSVLTPLQRAAEAYFSFTSILNPSNTGPVTLELRY
jgi:hypothetical protein